ncbi:MAG: tetratricopeptide repeat protein [Acidobacteria bacterium]|uniref:Tetratricopeptide repeat protein n=1 Tax=Candidatus Polarisedimenticola svalbardensis TaxID=2886004 RepID=A0A8J6XWL9_9BACT|nr:tetratricopeptide repeat protein [Candidatus Polarisedimenticola svalbardensis]
MKRISRTALVAISLAASLCLAGAAMAQEEAYQNGMNYFKSGKYVEAAAEFQALVDDAPAYDYGYFMLGNSFVKMGKTDQAISNFKQAIELNGEKYVYHHSLASAYQKSRQYRMVTETLNNSESIVEDRYKPAFYTTRGQAFYQLKKYSEAISDLEKAKALKPTEGVLTSLGVSYYKMGHHEKAAGALEKALDKNPKNATNNQLLAESLLEVGKGKNGSAKETAYGRALAAAERYLAAKPGNFDAINLVGRAALGAGDYGKAERSFTRALTLKPSYCFAMMNKAKAQIAQSKWKNAEGTLRTADKCDANNVLVHESLGFVLRKQKRLPEALSSYQTAYKLKPSASIKKAMDEVKHNIEVNEFNKSATAEEIANREAIAAEEARVAAEKAKQEEYKKKTDDD